MDPLRQALHRAAVPCGRERAFLFLAGSVALLVRGLPPLLLPWNPMQVRSVSSLVFWVVLVALRVWLVPRLTKRWAHPLEGRRPQSVGVWFAAGISTEVTMLAAIAATIFFVLAVALNPLWFAAAGAVVSLVSRSPWYFLVGAVVAWVPHPEAHRLDVACLAAAVAFLGHGTLMLLWPQAVPVPALRSERELVDDLLRLLGLAKAVDVHWLEKSSGLASPEQVRASISRLAALGWLVMESDGSVALAREGERELYAVQGWRPPVTPL